MRRHFLLPLSAALLLAASMRADAAEPLPRPPCAPGDPPYPAYTAEGALPAVEVWQNVALPNGDCFGALVGPMSTVAALSGRFRFAGTLDDLAARIGAVSETVGQLYWSTTDQTWRELISEAFALSEADTEFRRPDFTAEEVRSGAALYFALAAVREGSVAGHTKSLVNRAAAFYRFLRGVPGDEGAPLAR